MRLGKLITINHMATHGERNRVWLDIRVGRFWYVLIWRKGHWPFCYRSLDATPPREAYYSSETGAWHQSNRGRLLFGRYVH